jgi:hypothetical protein
MRIFSITPLRAAFLGTSIVADGLSEYPNFAGVKNE